MDIKMLDKNIHTNPRKGYLVRYVRSDTEYFRPHYHNYFEIFMMLKGSACHIINGEEQILSPGQLLFIRDFDIHDYKSTDGSYFEFVNIAFTKEIFEEMAVYLGCEFPSHKLMSSRFPPCIYLSEREKEKLFYSFTELGNYSDGTAKIKFRTLIINIFMKYFLDYEEERSEIPLWLEITVEKMKKPENFIHGSKQMYELCEKTREHLSRSMKKYYNTTIHDFINSLKLEYSVNLLINSNLSATDICYECGFENLSWFYKLFEAKYGTTPSKYRNAHGKIYNQTGEQL